MKFIFRIIYDFAFTVPPKNLEATGDEAISDFGIL